MTVPSEVNRSGPYLGNGVTTVFSYGFKIVNQAHLRVIRTDAAGNETVLTLGTNYSVAGVGNAGGGSVTVSPAPASGQKITILRAMPFTQNLDLENQGAYYAEDVERAFDEAAMRDQELAEGLQRAVKVPSSTDDPDGTIADRLALGIIRLADSADNLDTVAENVADVNTVAEAIGNVNTVAGSIASVNTVADNIASVNTVAGIAANVNTVAGDHDEIVALAGITGNINTVAGIAPDVEAVAGVAGDIPTIAENIEDVTNFAKIYLGPKTSDPTLRNDGSVLMAGDLYFNTASDLLRVFDGAEWRDASSQSLNMNSQSFTGNGSATSFTLAMTPAVAANAIVWVGGVRQVPNVDYTVSGSTLTFVVAPGNGVPVDTLVISTVSTMYAPANGTVGDASIDPASKLHNRINDVVSVRDFGAKGDGVTDDTAAILSADHYCRTSSPAKSLVFGDGVFMVSQLVINTGTRWFGNGKNATIIRQIAGSNKHLLYGVNSTENFSKTNQNEYLPFPYDFEIDGFDLDMQWTTTDKLNTSGHAFFVVGDHYNVKNLFVRNAAECGIVKKFIGDHSSNYDSRYLETAFKHIRVDYCGKHGFWDLGPHDSLHEDIIILDAGQAANNSYDGFNHDGSSSRNIAIHAATRQGRLRMRYSVSTWNYSSNEWSGGSNIEGAETANLGLFSPGNQFDPSTRFYAAWGGVNILLGGMCTLNIIRGNLQGPPAGRPACAGFKFSENAGDTVSQNDIDVLMSDQDAGAFQFNASNKGGNRLRAKVYTTANVGVFGTVSPLDDVLIRGTVNGSARYELNNMVQSAFLASIPAGGSYTWTFPYAFNKNPNVQVMPTTPSAALTTPLWVAELGPSSVTIFNPNANAQSVNVLATGVY